MLLMLSSLELYAGLQLMESTLIAERHMTRFVAIGMPRGCQHLYIFQKKCEAQGYAQFKDLKGSSWSCAFLAWAPLTRWHG